MRPLGFVNWRNVNTGFCFLMWLVAIVLAVIVLSHLVHAGVAGHGGTVTLAR